MLFTAGRERVLAFGMALLTALKPAGFLEAGRRVEDRHLILVRVDCRLKGILWRLHRDRVRG